MALRLVINSVPMQYPLPCATILYRITQEALRNASKHAPGALVTVRLQGTEDQVSLTVVDDGPGFDPRGTSPVKGLGLVSMQERARLVGGTVAFRAAPGGADTSSRDLAVGSVRDALRRLVG